MFSCLSDPDPFAPDEMAQHRTPEHCPTCLQLLCECRGTEEIELAREEPLPDPELGEAVEALDGMTAPERWEERRDLE